MKNISLCCLAALLLIISYPQLSFWLLAWVAIVPLLFILDGKSKGKAFKWGFLFGFLYFFGVLGWLVYVTYPGTFLLCTYLALYPAIFAAGFVYFKDLPLIPRIFVLASLWTVLEFMRSTLFTGFGWATLAHSQYTNLWMIQIADIVGIYGISFLIILVNLVVFETLKKKENSQYIRRLQFITACILIFCLLYGLWTLKTAHFSSSIKVAVVQSNVKERIQWTPGDMSVTLDKYMALTDAVSKTHPDIIVWPETSLPGVLSDNPSYLQRIQLKAMDLNIPILMGSVLDEGDHYFNSAILVGDKGAVKGHYNKIHLVPFGEFLPLRPILGWLNASIDVEDFTSGTEYTVFSVGKSGRKFGVLICFEDTLHDLPRQFVKAGAEFFVNMTNDAWFKDTKAPFLHLSGAVFECIQNKRSMARAANTGVSGFIDPLGRILELVQDEKGKKTFITAFAAREIPLNHQMTFYSKYADIFTYLCFVCILGGIFIGRRYAKKNFIGG